MTAAPFPRAGADRLRDTALRHVGEAEIPGVVVLVARGDEVHVEALGRLAIGGSPVTRDSLFRITSMTKPITAVATLALIEEGLLSLDQPVDELLPELARRRVLRRPDGPLEDTVPAERPITTRDLLTFTFGFGMAGGMFRGPEPWPIVSSAQELGLATLGPPDPSVQPDPDTWIANLGELPLIAQPGERWLYNTGASVLGVLLARAAEQPIADIFRTRVFEPLGMSDTAFWTADTTRLATAYRPTPDGLVVFDPPEGAWSRRPAFGDASAGLISTVDDLLAFSRMLLAGGEPLISRPSVSAMTADQLTEDQKARGGLGRDFFVGRSWGFCISVRADGAFGWDGGFGSSWLMDPGHDLTVIVMTQRAFETSAPPPVHHELRAAAYAML